LKEAGSSAEINETQAKILQILEQTGGTELPVLSERLQMKPSDLEREIASLRHMEKVRGELRDRKKVLRLW
jgi:DNA-binding MarR family transcriptional regulator